MSEEQEDKSKLWFSRASNLANELCFVLRGIDNGHIKSKPIMDTSDDTATEWVPESLEDHIRRALSNNGFSVRSQTAPIIEDKP